MNKAVQDDPRIDPRIKVMLADKPKMAFPNVACRDELLPMVEILTARPDWRDDDVHAYEQISPSGGVNTSSKRIISQPDGNTIELTIVQSKTPQSTACVYYIHGGGMMFGSSKAPNYLAWGRLLALAGATVVMVEFRNSLVPSASVPEVGEFPAGLDDCLSGLRWVHANAGELGIDPRQVVVAGESGGANLAIALALKLKSAGEPGLIAGLYLMCPFLAAETNNDPNSSEVENDGILSDGRRPNALAMAYGIKEVECRNPLAWPAYASIQDVTGLPETVVVVNECDSLRDDGVNFYRLLLTAGVRVRGRLLLGTIHGTEIDVISCPEISREAARELAEFAKKVWSS